MPKATIQGERIHYLQTGRGPDLVMIHGLAADLSFWFLRVAPGLTDRWRVTLYDLRGHGFSGMPAGGYRTQDLAGDLLALMDHLDLRRPHLAGHSFGGAVALQLALLQPARVRSLSLFDVRLPQLQPLPPLEETAYWRERREALRARGVEVTEKTPRILYSLLEETVGDGDDGGGRRGTPEGFRPWKPGSRMARRWERLRSETRMSREICESQGLDHVSLTRVEQPALLSFGERSRSLDTCRALEKCLPNHRTVIHPQVGHFFPAVRPDYVIQDLRPFLDEVERAESASRGAREGSP